ncbi:MAG TPA: hypothetical protein VGN12_05485 [Pirellulales bacterium]|jgi:hypothetical protein
MDPGTDLAAVLHALEVRQSMFGRWRIQYGGIKGRGTLLAHVCS